MKFLAQRTWGNWSLSRVVALAGICVLVLGQTSASTKFQKYEQVTFEKACGDGLDQNSACGNCVYAGTGVIALTKSASCGHICIQLPAGKKGDDMILVGRASEDQTPPGWKACGQPGNCDIGWSRFEGTE